MTDEVRFQLNLVGKLNPAKLRQQEDATLSARRESRETGRRLADEYAEEMLLRVVSLAREKGQDPNVVLRCAKFVCDRAWGQTKALTEEEKKGADAGSILDVLAAVSSSMSAIERAPTDVPSIEHTTIDNDNQADALFEEIRRERAGEIVDGELVSD